MLRARAILAAGMIVVGSLLIVRMASFGLQPGIAPGVLVGGLMILLGAHRLRLIRAAMRGTR